jgi:hypothetical protein
MMLRPGKPNPMLLYSPGRNHQIQTSLMRIDHYPHRGKKKLVSRLQIKPYIAIDCSTSTPHRSHSLSLHHGGKRTLIWEFRSCLNVQHQQFNYLHLPYFQQDPGKNALQPGR